MKVFWEFVHVCLKLTAIFLLGLMILELVKPAHGGEKRVAKRVDRAVRIFTSCTEEDCHLRTGSRVPADYLLTILFLDAPCELNIVGKERMRRAWQHWAAFQLGCWEPTPDGGFVVIHSNGQAQSDPTYWDLLPAATLHADNSATITEPNFSLDDYYTRANERRARDMMNHMREHP